MPVLHSKAGLHQRMLPASSVSASRSWLWPSHAENRPAGSGAAGEGGALTWLIEVAHPAHLQAARNTAV